MGNINSIPREEEPDIWWTNGLINDREKVDENISLNNHHQLSEKKLEDLSEFKFEMERKYEKRREILAAKKQQFDDLRNEVKLLNEEKRTQQMEMEKLRKENAKLLQSMNAPKQDLMEDLDNALSENTLLKDELYRKSEELENATVLLGKNRELQINIAEMQKELQNLNTVVVEFEKEREEYKTHVIALKDVISVSKKMLLIREEQLKELREKVESIEQTLAGKEMNLLSQDLKVEYERQLKSIRNLRTLYEERQRSDHKEKSELKRVIEDLKKELENEQIKHKEADERITELEELNSQKYDEIQNLDSNLGLAKAESRQFQAELAVINQLFSEILLGFNNSQEIDLDKLAKNLEDNHALLRTIVEGEESSSALPKILLDLVYQVNNDKNQENNGKLETINEETDDEAQNSSNAQINSVEEIVELLPKVWKVLIELLSHHKVPTNIINLEVDQHPCYKTVQTPKGPSLVLSVSQTFIRLKDLILEKKSLEKETGHLKQLNTHLETRLQDQEQRLGTVSTELNKTWNVVGKLQKEHQLLHTQKKILRYELAQKRKLLKTLREELEYSREKWQEARDKNSKTEKQCKQLRGEFASRRNNNKTLLINEDFNSQESGYSDERCSTSSSSSDEETDISETLLKPDVVQFSLLDEEEMIRNIAEKFVTNLLQDATYSIENKIATTEDEAPSTSTSKISFDEKMVAKELRLKRLEGECEQLMDKVVNTTQKSALIINKLDGIHEAYHHNNHHLAGTSSSSAIQENTDEENG